MELIIKPTSRCNFACTFCSAYGMDICHPKDSHVQPELRDYILKSKPCRLIITGGDPLMMDPGYYYELHELGDLHISATTNLKDFYLHPEKWAKLFNEPWFFVATSFNYGDSRRWDKDTVFTEELFLKVMDKWDQYVNKPHPLFIAVIDDSNEDTVYDLIDLAKRLNTQVRINNALAFGKQDETYQRYKLWKIYCDIIDKGLGQYEVNCSNMKISRCPKNIVKICRSTIRCVYVDNDHKLHVGVCDEQTSAGIELPEDEWYPEEVVSEVIDHTEYISDKCSYCELFNLCNGCRTNRIVAKADPKYCEEMKKLESRIIEQGWLL